MTNLASIPAGWEVPVFDVTVLLPKRSTYCIVIPVINEGDRLLGQLKAMAALHHGLDVLIADGGSTDGSTETGRLRDLGVAVLLVKRGPGRLSAQLRMGFAYALAQGYAGIIAIDGNGKDGIEGIPRFVEALDAGFDFVQGSRYIAGGEAQNTPWDRTLAVRLIHAPLISLGARFHYTDTTNGFRAYSPRLLRDPRVLPFRAIFDTYNLHYYLAIEAPRLGYRVKEIPVRRVYPARGQVPTKIRGITTKLQILWQLLLSVVGRYRPGPG